MSTQVVVARLEGLTGRVSELLANPSRVVVHDVASTTRPSASTSPADPGRFG